jgi:hypothetical protein
MIAMALQLELNVKQSIRQLLSEVLELLLDIGDFFIYKKHVTLSELVLFSWTLSRAIWFSIYGVNGGVFDVVPIPYGIWVAAFWALALFKIVSCFLLDNRFRSWAVIASAVLWGSLTILAAFSGSTQPVAVTYGIFTALSLFIAIRLINDKGQHAI